MIELLNQAFENIAQRLNTQDECLKATTSSLTAVHQALLNRDEEFKLICIGIKENFNFFREHIQRQQAIIEDLIRKDLEVNLVSPNEQVRKIAERIQKSLQTD